MVDNIVMFIAGLNLVIITLLIVMYLKLPANKLQNFNSHLEVLEKNIDKSERSIKDDLARNREETGTSAKALREEVINSLNKFNESVLNRLNENTTTQMSQLDTFSNQLQHLTQLNNQKADKLREDVSVSLNMFKDSVTKGLADMGNTQMKQLESFATLLQGTMQSNEQRLKASQEEVSSSLKGFKDSVGTTLTEMSGLQVRQLNSFSTQLQTLLQSNEQRIKSLQEENGKKLEEMRRTLDEKMGNTSKQLRDELAKQLKDFTDSINKQMSESSKLQVTQHEHLLKQLQVLTQANEQRMDKLRETVDIKLKDIQEDNGKRLEEMRKTVDEKLNETLEKRLGESFKLVSDRLEQVHKGLGEMQSLATGVGDLKRVLTNVKTRGIWGEIQLGNLLEQILTPEQYAQNVAPKPSSGERVEFAIKLPGRDKEVSHIWLPIDAKFPQEDYQRLIDAQEQANVVLAEDAAKALEIRVKSEAKDIAMKYISVPHTTEFAILFLPIEGLYAEVLRRPGLCDYLMREYKVVVTGPTTLAALLNSLQMGFRTLAIERRSSEVWSLLGAVKTEFGKFGDLLEKTSKKLNEASNSIDNAAKKSRTIQRKLKNVQELPQSDAILMLDSVDEKEIAATMSED